jgi:pimeloyl-ACP methyl ester carboxylesterase
MSGRGRDAFAPIARPVVLTTVPTWCPERLVLLYSASLKTLEVPIDIGSGPPVVLLHGYAMRPDTYRGLADLLATRCRVVIPDFFALRGRWSYPEVLDAFTATLDALGLEKMTLLGHSFGGGIELGFASRWPARVVELVFSDTLAVSREWGLADEVLRHPFGLLRLATPIAASAFARQWLEHPRQLIGAGWWGFTSSRDGEGEACARAGMPAHVLWANRDSILARSDGESFARELNASFTVASAPDGRPIDHDWMFQEPALFFSHLEDLKLNALAT